MKILFCLAITLIAVFATTSVSFAQTKTSNHSNLTQKQQNIVPIASCMATGNMDKLKESINNGLDAGLTVNEIKEIMVHLYAYCGFPRALNGLGAVDQVLSERQKEGITDVIGADATPIPKDTDILELGTKVQTQLAGQPVNIASSPAIDTFLKTHLFGDLFARDVLSYEDREIATISALASMNGTQSQYMSHLRLGVNAGLSEEALQDIVNILDSEVSSEIADNAQIVLDNFLSAN